MGTRLPFGKKLRLPISINYIEDNESRPPRSGKRGKSSVTEGMLTERDTEIIKSDPRGYYTKHFVRCVDEAHDIIHDLRDQKHTS